VLPSAIPTYRRWQEVAFPTTYTTSAHSNSETDCPFNLLLNTTKGRPLQYEAKNPRFSYHHAISHHMLRPRAKPKEVKFCLLLFAPLNLPVSAKPSSDGIG
jgi:hypothetical protein